MTIMTIKQLIKLENKAKEVWVVSPSLHYDVENTDFSELVSVNLGEKTKYKYIVPATPIVAKNMKLYKKRYGLSNAEMDQNFCILHDTDFVPFLEETAIYNATTKPIACAAPATKDGNDVIRFSTESSKKMAKAFKKIWKKYKRVNP